MKKTLLTLWALSGLGLSVQAQDFFPLSNGYVRGGFGYLFDVGEPYVTVRGGGEFYRTGDFLHGADLEVMYFGEGQSEIGFEAQYMPLLLNYRVSWETPYGFTAFGGLGVGYTYIDAERRTSSSYLGENEDNDWLFTFSPSIGAGYNVTEALNVLLEVRWLILSDDEVLGAEIDADGDLGIQATVRFRF